MNQTAEQPSQIRPYDSADPLTNGTDRGRLLFDALKREGFALGNVLLDVGCGYGGLSLAYVRRGRTAYSVDTDIRNIQMLRKRIACGEMGPGVLHPVHGSALDIPVTANTADLALMIGVVEWLGYTTDQEPVTELQASGLREVYRALKPGGTLVVGTKNRLFPRYFWSDSQLQKPFVNALPRKMANRLARTMWNIDYRGYIYSLWGWQRLIEATGFSVVASFVPIVSYQYPRALARPWRPTILPRDLFATLDSSRSATTLTAKTSGRDSIRSTYYRLFASLGLLGLFGGSFLLVCRRP